MQFVSIERSNGLESDLLSHQFMLFFALLYLYIESQNGSFGLVNMV